MWPWVTVGDDKPGMSPPRIFGRKSKSKKREGNVPNINIKNLKERNIFLYPEYS
jgi:hypothetical protein